LDDEHRLPVERLAILNEELHQLRERVREEGWTSTGSMGQPAVNPHVAVMRSAEVAISRLERQLGISVTSHRAATITDDVTAAEARTEGERARTTRIRSTPRRPDPRR